MAYVLEYAKFDFSMRVLEPLQLPAYKGSIIRGAMGRAFRQACCATGTADCRDCILAIQCPNAYVFETLRTTAGKGPEYCYIPHPFVLEPPLEEKTCYSSGEVLKVGLVLIGRGINYLPYFIFAFERLGQNGLGSSRAKLKLEEVAVLEEGIPHLIFRAGANCHIDQFKHSTFHIDCPDVSDEWFRPENLENNSLITLDLITPFRIMEKGRVTFKLSFPLLIRNIFRRLDILGKAHGSGGLGISFGSWLAAAEGVHLRSGQTTWREWERYSARQQVRMSLGGLVGKIEIAGYWRPFLPFMEIARIIHVGKGTSFGLGKINLYGTKI